MTEDSFSVLISVYQNDDPEHFRLALESVFDQTVEPAEVVLVADGPLTDSLDTVIDEFKESNREQLTVVRLQENHGLGTALRVGVEHCSHELVARMDSDDISVSDRFETQLEYLAANPGIDVVGAHVGEFHGNPDDIHSVRSVPATASDVESMATFRSPANHPSVMFRRSSVLEAGNYRSLRSMQDYELWVRMLSQGYTIENIPAVLVKCRAGSDLYGRRGGLEYARLEVWLQREFLRMGAISPVEFIRNLATRVPIRLVPNRVRTAIYQALLREESEPSADTSRI
ncbi:glycosyltransferase [Natronolimnobius sp. AArcel1]|uniref:glycosyltransferase n=1 Tax=Natronolimnobius sp. AArcel1 TaxID=1679093 RepID=UPI0013E9AAC5|nr:glycosyltransferase [Natronolimnobius sp. AArcel1]NGM69085.1 glycosyltransferase [Natronolimnobius sp. AArcel1]